MLYQLTTRISIYHPNQRSVLFRDVETTWHRNPEAGDSVALVGVGQLPIQNVKPHPHRADTYTSNATLEVASATAAERAMQAQVRGV